MRFFDNLALTYFFGHPVEKQQRHRKIKMVQNCAATVRCSEQHDARGILCSDCLSHSR